MSPLLQLKEAYGLWRTWTEAEAEALRGADWRQVDRCQEAKETLQTEILRLTESAQAEAEQAGISPSDALGEIRGLIADLIPLEAANGRLLEQHRLSHGRQRDEMEQTSQNLQRVRRSYVPRPEAAWQSYS
jgi:hypothetical protein